MANINKPQHAPSIQLINTPSTYPIKCLTYLEMQQLRDQGLCLNCNDIDTTSHRCPVKRIVLVLPDEDPNIEQISMEIQASTIQEQPSNQDIPLLALNHDSDPKAMRLELHPVVEEFRQVYIGVIDDGSTEAAIKSGSSMSDQNCPGVYFFRIVPSEVLCMRQALDLILSKEQECTNAHKVFAEMNKSRCERKILIFDPGGDIFNAKCFLAIWSNHAGYFNINGHGNKMHNKFDKCISDLEDKVDFEGVGNDTHISIPAAHRIEQSLIHDPKDVASTKKAAALIGRTAGL